MELKEIPINKIKPNPLQPREHFDRGKIKELADSVKRVGLIQPITVRPNDGIYEIIAGERRWKALQIAGVKKVPAIVKNLENGKLMIESLIENLHREDLSDIEKAKALKIIKEKEKVETIRELSRLVGLSDTAINYIIDSAGMREELKGPLRKVSSSVITETRGLEKKERKKIIERAHKEDFGGRKTRELVSIAKASPEHIRKDLIDGKIGIEEAKAEIVKHKLMEELGTRELPEPKMSVEEARGKIISNVIETSDTLNRLSYILEVLHNGKVLGKHDKEYLKKLKEHFEQFLIPAVRRNYDILKKVLKSIDMEFDV